MLLLFVSAAWGSAFPLMKNLILRMPVEDLLAERYLIAAVTLFLIRPQSLRGLSRETWINGIVLGIMFGVGQSAQAVALDDLPSAVSGFAVGCSVVITPILALVLFRVRVPGRVWLGVGLALLGMTVFTLLRGVNGHDFSLLALAATLMAAGLYSGHTLLLAHLTRAGKRFDAYALTVIQLGTIGVLTGGVAVHDGIVLPGQVSDWAILAHLSVISCALGFLARSYGQKHVPAVPSAVLMSSQPLWVTAIAVIWFNEPIGWPMAIGGGLMAGAMLLAVPMGAPPRRPRPLPPAVQVSRKASRVLADLRIKRDDPLKFDATPLPPISRNTCDDTESCPWSNLAPKGNREPSLDQLIERAKSIVRAKNQPGPGCCQSVTLVGRCLCSLMQESDQQPTSGWFRAR
ncbi:DMT family transporter [Nonomuraea sp. NPDC050536]|uniref:DMT family transporter n=1 Tax=Nonomuraea sp. NPDC050536 TaxID=3364366 RepID=UPI0037CB37AF